MFGVPLFVDDQVETSAAVIAFQAFATRHYVEMIYEDFARIELPRVASFAKAELSASL
jgi:hypothetical protein